MTLGGEAQVAAAHCPKWTDFGPHSLQL